MELVVSLEVKAELTVEFRKGVKTYNKKGNLPSVNWKNEDKERYHEWNMWKQCYGCDSQM